MQYITFSPLKNHACNNLEYINSGKQIKENREILLGMVKVTKCQKIICQKQIEKLTREIFVFFIYVEYKVIFINK